MTYRIHGESMKISDTGLTCHLVPALVASKAGSGSSVETHSLPRTAVMRQLTCSSSEHVPRSGTGMVAAN